MADEVSRSDAAIGELAEGLTGRAAEYAEVSAELNGLASRLVNLVNLFRA